MHTADSKWCLTDVTNTCGKHKNYVQCKLLSRVRLFVTPWALQSLEFSRPESWSGQPFPSPRDVPNPGIKPRSPTLQADSLPAEPQGKPNSPLKHNLKQFIFIRQVPCLCSKSPVLQGTSMSVIERPRSITQDEETFYNAENLSSIGDQIKIQIWIGNKNTQVFKRWRKVNFYVIHSFVI